METLSGGEKSQRSDAVVVVVVAVLVNVAESKQIILSDDCCLLLLLLMGNKVYCHRQTWSQNEYNYQVHDTKPLVLGAHNSKFLRCINR